MSTSRMVPVVAAVAAIALLGVPVLAAPDGTDPEVNEQLAEVRRATSQYQDVEAAQEAGYQLDGHCVPGMGVHAIRGEEIDDEVDRLSPEALVYAPGDDGLELVAVEYLAAVEDPEDVELFGRPFDPGLDEEGIPPSLHAWVWQGNPDGVFNPANPNVTCPG